MKPATAEARAHMMKHIRYWVQFVHDHNRDICTNCLDAWEYDQIDESWNDMTACDQGEWIWSKYFTDNDEVFEHFKYLMDYNLIMDPNEHLKLVINKKLIDKISGVSWISAKV